MSHTLHVIPSSLPPHQGVCSSWLASLDPALRPTVPVWAVPGTLSLSKVTGKPAILIGPGTGCAPFRAFIEERVSAAVGSEDHRHSLPTGSKAADTMLFFGCRSRSADFFFRDEWQSLVAQNCLTLHTAFSRDQVSPLHCTLPPSSAQAHPSVCRRTRSMSSTRWRRPGSRCGTGCTAGAHTSSLLGEQQGLPPAEGCDEVLPPTHAATQGRCQVTCWGL